MQYFILRFICRFGGNFALDFTFNKVGILFNRNEFKRNSSHIFRCKDFKEKFSPNP